MVEWLGRGTLQSGNVTCSPAHPGRMIAPGAFHPEEEMMTQSDANKPADSKKPARSKGPVGLLLYGVLTILGGLALVLVAE